MITQLSQLETSFFNVLNQFAEPLIRAGLGSPVLWPSGAIVIETVGRKTGRKLNVPLLATRIGNLLLVSTVRRRSQWLENLATNPEIRYWIGGRSREATAFVFAPGLDAPLDKLPPLASCLADALIPQSRLLGVGFAILAPRQADEEDD